MQNFDASPTLQFRVLQYKSSQGANPILGTKWEYRTMRGFNSEYYNKESAYSRLYACGRLRVFNSEYYNKK